MYMLVASPWDVAKKTLNQLVNQPSWLSTPGSSKVYLGSLLN